MNRLLCIFLFGYYVMSNQSVDQNLTLFPNGIDIGTNNPQAALHMRGSALIESNITYSLPTGVTNGSTYVLTIQSRGTNLYPVMTEWK